MNQIILDFGSGNTCKNNWNIAKQMIDELAAIDTKKHEIIIKWQLFFEAGDNIPLSRNIFHNTYHYAKELGYQTTASVFDKELLEYLLTFEIPFVKIANNRNLDYLIGDIPRKIPIYISYSEPLDFVYNLEMLACVSEYPSTIEAYETAHDNIFLRNAISDHTTNWDLYNKYKPRIYEVHYKLQDSTGLDAGPFSRTPEMLKEIL